MRTFRTEGRSGEPAIGSLFESSLVRWGRRSPRRLAALAPAAWRMWLARRRRVRTMERLGIPIPYVVALSPTMRCNYSCAGCYAADRDSQDELSTVELDALFDEAARLGVLAILVTGGEPLLRRDIPGLVERHRGLFFVLITNGSLLEPSIARRLARSGNALTLVSIEGSELNTDSRRGAGAHAKAMRALEMLEGADAFHGFAATACMDNVDYIASDVFLREMMRLGCATGYYSEYVPCDPKPRTDWLLDAGTRETFRQRVLDLRRRAPLVLVQFPHDEYGTDNVCSAAGTASIHIGPRGDVEPCPFVPISCDSIRSSGLAAALRSPFLRVIRERPALLRRERLACALFEHRGEIAALASRCREAQIRSDQSPRKRGFTTFE